MYLRRRYQSRVLGSEERAADFRSSSLIAVPAVGVVSLLIGWYSLTVICGVYWLISWATLFGCVGGTKFVKIACYLLGRLVIIFAVGVVLFCQYLYYFTGAL